MISRGFVMKYSYYLEGPVSDELYAVGEGDGSAGGALASGVDDGLDSTVDLRQRHLSGVKRSQRQHKK